MTDSRFTTVAEGIDDLLNLVDIDERDDLETLLMVLLDRPVGVEEAWDDDSLVASLDVLVHGNESNIGTVFDFPLTVVELARSCAEDATHLGPYTQNGADPSAESQALHDSTDAELISALQHALGKVRIFNMMDGDERRVMTT